VKECKSGLTNIMSLTSCV